MHLNTPRLISDSTATTVWRNDNTEPFGDSAADENPSGLGTFWFPLRFGGWQYADKETGEFYNYFRTLDPAIDRYQQSDLVGLAAGVNTYARVLSDPLNRIDPVGLATTIPGPNGIPVPVPVPPAGGPGSSAGAGGKGGLIPPELDPNRRPQPKTFPEIRVPPFPPSSPPPEKKSICEHLFNQCIKAARTCPPPVAQVGRAFCLASYILCITISGSGGSGGDPAPSP